MLNPADPGDFSLLSKQKFAKCWFPPFSLLPLFFCYYPSLFHYPQHLISSHRTHSWSSISRWPCLILPHISAGQGHDVIWGSVLPLWLPHPSDLVCYLIILINACFPLHVKYYTTSSCCLQLPQGSVLLENLALPLQLLSLCISNLDLNVVKNTVYCCSFLFRDIVFTLHPKMQNRKY